jgi:hypothetical protein
MNVTATLIEVFVILCIINLFYWHVVHKTLLRALRFRLFARRDELRWMAIDGREDHSSFAYREVEEFICKTIAVVPSISLASLAFSMIRDPNRKPSENLERFRREASSQLTKLSELTVRDAMYTMALNSPILVIVAVFVVLALWVIGRFNKMLFYQQAEQFVSELPSDGREPREALPQAA